jgi:alkanesulfonate monooxygenase SsuD/methylene tetrahydromethanopterin reductase-like flavin-dependent oxidoreductase (luciferase family)
MRAYRAQYQPSPREPAPQTLLCCFVICAATDTEAERQARVMDLRRLEMALRLENPVPTLAEAEARAYSAEEREYMRGQRARTIVGDPSRCKARLLELASQYAADELMIVTITGDYASRARSYELLAEAWAAF